MLSFQVPAPPAPPPLPDPVIVTSFPPSGPPESVVAAVEARLQALESRSPVTGETDAVYHRLEELEERLEFSERLLAQSREGAALPRAEER